MPSLRSSVFGIFILSMLNVTAQSDDLSYSPNFIPAANLAEVMPYMPDQGMVNDNFDIFRMPPDTADATHSCRQSYGSSGPVITSHEPREVQDVLYEPLPLLTLSRTPVWLQPPQQLEEDALTPGTETDQIGQELFYRTQYSPQAAAVPQAPHFPAVETAPKTAPAARSDGQENHNAARILEKALLLSLATPSSEPPPPSIFSCWRTPNLTENRQAQAIKVPDTYHFRHASQYAENPLVWQPQRSQQAWPAVNQQYDGQNFLDIQPVWITGEVAQQLEEPLSRNSPSLPIAAHNPPPCAVPAVPRIAMYPSAYATRDIDSMGYRVAAIPSHQEEDFGEPTPTLGARSSLGRLARRPLFNQRPFTVPQVIRPFNNMPHLPYYHNYWPQDRFFGNIFRSSFQPRSRLVGVARAASEESSNESETSAEGVSDAKANRTCTQAMRLKETRENLAVAKPKEIGRAAAIDYTTSSPDIPRSQPATVNVTISGALTPTNQSLVGERESQDKADNESLLSEASKRLSTANERSQETIKTGPRKRQSSFPIVPPPPHPKRRFYLQSLNPNAAQ